MSHSEFKPQQFRYAWTLTYLSVYSLLVWKSISFLPPSPHFTSVIVKPLLKKALYGYWQFEQLQTNFDSPLLCLNCLSAYSTVARRIVDLLLASISFHLPLQPGSIPLRQLFHLSIIAKSLLRARICGPLLRQSTEAICIIVMAP